MISRAPSAALVIVKKGREMSRDDEDRILHGLYYHREDIDQEFRVSRAQLL